MVQVLLRSFTSFLALATLAASVPGAWAQSVPLPKPRPAEPAANTTGSNPTIPRGQAGQATKPAAVPALSTSSADLAALKEAITAARRGNIAHAAELQGTVNDTLA